MSTSPKQFKLILVDIQAELCDHWRVAFEAYPDVEIHNAYFQKVKEFDCMVSPANSFGLMDGGIDLAIRAFYGMGIQYKVQKRIQKEFYGEQPVGTSMIVFTENEDYPFLAHTPTMRVPHNIAGTDNVYNAMFAMLGAVANHNKTSQAKINTVLCPGLGTATGAVPLKEAARQMALAYRNFLHPTTNMVWKNLKNRHDEIVGK